MTSRLHSLRSALGPGIIWAGAAIGVSHLVQSTRAGATFGLGLVGVVIFANLYKYPAFSFGPRYAAATGTSLLEGYRQEGTWALVLYAILTVGSMFTIQAAVTFVTVALLTNLTGWDPALFDIPGFVVLSAGLMASCAIMLAIGEYKWLDKIVKLVVLVLTVTTLLCTFAVLDKLPLDSLRLLPEADWITTATTAVMLCGLIGWMPATFEISIWHSLWTLARREETGVAPSVSTSLFDFNIGYIGTAILALCFVLMGAATMYASGEVFTSSPAGFAAQIIELYTKNLGTWAGPVVTIAAVTVMFSTTLSVVDGLPRALATLAARFQRPERAGVFESTNRRVYWVALAILFFGSLVLIQFFLASLTLMADVAATMSLTISPALAWLNHRAMVSDAVPSEARPGTLMRVYSRFGIAVSLMLAVYFVSMRWLVA